MGNRGTYLSSGGRDYRARRLHPRTVEIYILRFHLPTLTPYWVGPALIVEGTPFV